jgi:hypothetical protein
VITRERQRFAWPKLTAIALRATNRPQQLAAISRERSREIETP